jgi:hypothetical protein
MSKFRVYALVWHATKVTEIDVPLKIIGLSPAFGLSVGPSGGVSLRPLIRMWRFQ